MEELFDYLIKSIDYWSIGQLFSCVMVQHYASNINASMHLFSRTQQICSFKTLQSYSIIPLLSNGLLRTHVFLHCTIFSLLVDKQDFS